MDLDQWVRFLIVMDVHNMVGVLLGVLILECDSFPLKCLNTRVFISARQVEDAKDFIYPGVQESNSSVQYLSSNVCRLEGV